MEPLAHKLRPASLAEFVGQDHLVGPNKPLRVAIKKGLLFSFVLWGPPGSGKTTLARIYARSLKGDLFELSAVSAGKDDIRKIINHGRGQLDLDKKSKILFLDEIHRFSKSQQDFLLPYVESGELTLIGATTENPSFEVISALLSRCRVFVLEPLNEEGMRSIIKRVKVGASKAAIDWLVRMADGDARQALTVLEATRQLYGKITVENLKNALQSKTLRYDRAGDEHYNLISAYIKSLRASQADAALYYLARMVDGGEDPKFIARRMVIFASEDIGMAQPTALVVANEVFQAVSVIGPPEAQINLAHGTVYLANAKKDRGAYDAYFRALADVKKYGNLAIPLKIRNPSTKLMKSLKYGEGYERYPSTKLGTSAKEDLLPEKLKGRKYL
ncbi:MAG: replication-associated recombination protein A [Patescibacteria group bacterium]|nr:replication-associated recombination protein A [Patescibacteria group bacterium]